MRWKRLAFLSTWLNLMGFVGLFCFAFVCFVVVPFGSELVVFGIPLSSHLIYFFLLSTSQQSSFHEIVSAFLCVLWLSKDHGRDLGSHYAGHWVNLLRKSATPRAFSPSGKEKGRREGGKGTRLGKSENKTQVSQVPIQCLCQQFTQPSPWFMLCRILSSEVSE